MFHIVLVNPPRNHLVALELPEFVDLGGISSFPPIGLMYLAQALRQDHPDNRVTILDSVTENLDASATAERVKRLAPDVVGLTSFTYTFYDVLETARALRHAGLTVPIAVGGPHMFLFGPETLSHEEFDLGVVGDGEEVFSRACAAWREGTPLPDLPGLLRRENGTVVGSGVAKLSDLAAVPIPALDLIDHQRYYSTIGKAKAVGTICSSRGCPFRCTFCQVPHTPYRLRPVADVVDEMQCYVERGINDFFFFDDLFNITRKRVMEVSQEILDRGLRVGWMFRGRVDKIGPEMMALAVRSGCHTVSLGVEDATDEGLRAIRKGITIAQAREAVRIVRKSGCRSSTNWIIGFPQHRTRADLEHLLATAIEIDADFAQFSILQCLPGSELYDQAVAEGGIPADAWRNYVLRPTPRFEPPVWEKHLSKAVLFDAYARMYKRYYFRPKVIAREIMRTASWDEFVRKASAFRKALLGGLPHWLGGTR